MSTYAYRKPDRDEASILYAKDATNEDRFVRFYCPNPDFDAHLYIKAYHGQIDFTFQL